VGKAKRTSESKAKAEEKTRVTLRLPSALLATAQHRCVDERTNLNALVADALRAYLRGGR
jgi:hypothetical protein